MRRIITDENAKGRSYVLKAETVAPLGLIWQTEPGNPLGREPEGDGYDLDFKPGTDVRSMTVPPEAVMLELLKTMRPPGLDEKGFHKTPTFDVVVLLEGRLILALDEEEIEMAPGDVVVQRSTNHTWRNPGDSDARCLVVVHRA